MQHIIVPVSHLAPFDSMIAERFARSYGITTLDEYLDLIDSRTTAHLNNWAADRVLRTAGQQRRSARLSIEDGIAFIAIPMNNPRTGTITWAKLYFSTWLNVIECGADNAWHYALKARDQNKGQVRTAIPMSRGDRVTNTTIARIIANAKVGQQARVLDGDPMNLRSENVYLLGNPSTAEGKAGRAKTHTRLHSRDKLALRTSLSKRRG